ncbi:MAG TPA: phenylalanine--tRNA ligase subunit beta, partial [Alphaproteobacteria bacterium]|nr:phenylalanine--tRNA ligase subunit beta [Alphaproteobacteria bacterium]
MKFTLSWLKEFLDTQADLKTISEKLTEIGLEVENVVDYSTSLKHFTVAQILETEQHPNADRLRVCKVDAGNGEVLSIVCGAPNARPNIKIPLARIGTIIPNGNFEIKKSKIRNVESNGMLCSASELNISEEGEGILELPENSIVGDEFAKYIGLDDAVVEIAITPNRGDCLGVYGIARDLAAAGLGELKIASSQAPRNNSFNSPIKISINNENGIWFFGVYIKNINNYRSPEWLKKRLESVGKKSISAAVDITNYLTITFGRPAHVYDADKLNGNLSVRLAKNGEKLTALDAKEYELTENILVIADEQKPQAIAGVIGGLDSGVTENTKNIFLEIALFTPEAVMKSGRQLMIDTDSRYRFERNVDFNSHQLTSHAVNLITEICGGQASNIEIAGNVNKSETKINFDLNLVQKRCGLEIGKEKAKEILQKLGFKIETENGTQLNLIVPSYRSDIAIKEDVVEEIVRIIGYNNIPTIYLEKPVVEIIAETEPQKIHSKIRLQLSSSGATEAVTFSFTNSKLAEKFIASRAEFIEVANPISSELDVMRPSLLVNILDIFAKNIARGKTDLEYFEIANIFKKKEAIKDPSEYQAKNIAIVQTGLNSVKSAVKEEEKFDYNTIKQKADLIIANYIDPEKLKIERNNKFNYYHPGISACYFLGNKLVAVFGELNPSLNKVFDIKQKLYAAEIFIENLPQPKAKTSTAIKALELFNFQPVER